MRLNLHDKLTPKQWERVLFERPYTVAHGWSQRAYDEGIILDFSRVGWVEPKTVVHAVLLTEGALLAGINVDVRLPRTTPTGDEAKTLNMVQGSKDALLLLKARRISNMVRRRRLATAALAHLRFSDALNHFHIVEAPGILTITSGFDWGFDEPTAPEANMNDDIEEAEDYVEEKLPPPWYFKVAYGLRWIPSPRSEEGRRMINHLSEVDILGSVLFHGSQRISAADSQTVAHVFLKELVENTTDHSGREWALVAAWSRPRRVSLKKDEIIPCETNFANRCKGYPVLEVTVGDSGKGIPESLRVSYEANKPELHPSVMSPERSDIERILTWSMDKWSSRSTKQKRGTRGLYRVTRIVRKYDGCISLRSDLGFVGLDALSADPPDLLLLKAKNSFARSPGTVIHIRLPVILVDYVPEKIVEPALNEVRFTIVDCGRDKWNDEQSTIDWVYKRVSKACTLVSTQPFPSCVIVDFAFASMERRVLERVLLALVDIAHPVAIVAANIKYPGWDMCAETINSLLQSSIQETKGNVLNMQEVENASPSNDAILFRHADGSYAWIGTTEESIQDLEALWEQGELSPLDLSRLIPNIEHRNRFVRRWSEAYHIAVRTPDGGIRLRFNESDIDKELNYHLSQRIEEQIYADRSPSVLSSNRYPATDGGSAKVMFRTPALEEVYRFINVSDLVLQVGVDRCMAVLAQKCSHEVEWETPGQMIEVLCDAKTNRLLLTRFCSYLAQALGNNFRISINQVNPRDLPVIGQDSLVVVFMEIISTGNLLQRILNQISRAKRKPLAIISVLETARKSDDFVGYGGKHQCPVILLATVDLSAPAGYAPDRVINISPIDLKPEREIEYNDRLRTYPISSKKFAEMVRQTASLYFDHVVRFNGRHFCFYLDPLVLVGQQDTAEGSWSSVGSEIIDVYQEVIKEWCREEETIDLICYTRNDARAAQVITEALAQRYSSAFGPMSALGWEINAVYSRVGKRLPMVNLLDEPPSPSPRTVVAIDWGAVTGHNIREMLRLAAMNGATRVLVVVFLSQLPLEEEDSLTQLHSIVSSATHTEGHVCSVSVRFLARFPVQAYDALHCPHCRQLARLKEEERFHQTDLIRRYVNAARQRLRPYTVDDVRERRSKYESGELPRSDDFITTESLIKTVQLRDKLEAARFSTAQRYSFYQHICQIKEGLEGGDATALQGRSHLMSLLAAEWIWLKQEPLSLPLLRRTIAEMAVQLAIEENRPEVERRNAIVVLRTASKEAFATHLYELFQKFLGMPELMAQLMYCVFTYLQREYLSRDSLDRLVEQLGKCQNELRDRPASDHSYDLVQTVHSLFLQAINLSYGAKQDFTNLEVWRALRYEWADRYERHHPMSDTFSYLFLGLLEKKLTDKNSLLQDAVWKAKWRQLRDAWAHFEPQVINIAHKLQLLEPFIGEIIATGLLSMDSGAAFSLDAAEIINQLNVLYAQIDLFAEKPASVRSADQWQKFTGARQWLYDGLINPGIRGLNGRAKASKLLQLLETCPCIVQPAINTILSDLQASEDNPLHINIDLLEEPVAIFCHDVVFVRLFRELLKNAIDHGDDRFPVMVKLSLEGNSSVLLHCSNFTKVLASQPGHGLRRNKQCLEAYGGDLIWHEDITGRTFEVVAQFIRW